MTESEIIKQCKSGDREAFNTLISNYNTQVINIAYGMLTDREDACDAAQEVFVKVYRSIGSFNEKSSFATWLYRITANTCSDFLRKRSRRSNVISLSGYGGEENKELDIEDENASVEDGLEMTERQTAVRKALGELKEEHRLMITMCDLQGMSYDQIADVMKIPTGTVKSRINRARQALKKILLEKRELFL